MQLERAQLLRRDGGARPFSLETSEERGALPGQGRIHHVVRRRPVPAVLVGVRVSFRVRVGIRDTFMMRTW